MKILAQDERALLRWWHKRQLQMLRREADVIRNGLLQEVFVARRHIELTGQSHRSDHPNFESYLTKLETLYAALESLSDRLCSPYLQSPLSLAIQHAALPWQEPLSLKFSCPDTWSIETIELTHLLVTVTEALCQHLANSTVKPQNCELNLKRHGDRGELMLSAHYVNSTVCKTASSHHSESLTYALKMFQVLNQSEDSRIVQRQMVHPCKLIWVLSW